MNRETIVPLILSSTVSGFLVLNVVLGMFGVLWYNVSMRKSEIGLRRAVGATTRSISNQIIFEALVLASIAVLAGTFFAIQFPVLRVFNFAPSTYLVALGLSLLLIYLLVILCALYPSKSAAKIYPREVLSED